MEKLLEKVSGYFYLSVTKKTEKILSAISNGIKTALENEINFKPREKDFHMTIEFFEKIAFGELLKKQIEYNEKFSEIKKNNEGYEINYLNENAKFDETLHKGEILVSYVNDRLYFILKPHNENSLIKGIKKKGEIHISLGYIEQGEDKLIDEKQIEKFLEIFKKIRDKVLKDREILLNWSKLNLEILRK